MAGPNATWVKWLEENAQELEGKGLQSHQAFWKAARALSQCPIKINTPQEALGVKGIGKHIMQFLEKKIRSEVNSEATFSGKHFGLQSESDDSLPPAKTKRNQCVPNDGSTGSKRRTDYTAMPSDEDNQIQSKKNQAKEVAPKKRAYSPLKGSAAWAIMIALYSLGRNERDGLDVPRTQKEIIREGQPWTSTSFTEGSRHAGQKGKYFTGFNGMKTLVEKCLVVKEGRGENKGWRLSQEGYLMARKLIRTLEETIVGEGRRTERGLRVPELGDLVRDWEDGYLDSDQEKKYARKADRQKKKKPPVAAKSKLSGVISTFSDEGETEENSGNENDYQIPFTSTAPALANFPSQVLLPQNSAPKVGQDRVPNQWPSVTPALSSSLSMGNVQRRQRQKEFSLYEDSSSKRPGDVARRSTLIAPIEARMATKNKVSVPPSRKDEGSRRAGENDDDCPFYFWYLDGEKRVNTKREAQNFLDVDMLNIYKIEFQEDCLQHTFRKTAVLLSTGHDGDGEEKIVREGTRVGWLKGRFSLLKCRPWDETDKVLINVTSNKARSKASNNVCRKAATDTLSSHKGPEKKVEDVTYQLLNTNDVEIIDITSPEVTLPEPSTSQVQIQDQNSRNESTLLSSSVEAASGDDGFSRRMEPYNFIDPTRSSQVQAADISCVPLEFSPADYKVTLLLDTREGGNSGEAASGLRSRGINVEMRSLEVGDVIWIAVRHIKRGDTYDEIVLNYVLERKRLDDLIQSVTGGRYAEQKGRMTRSGITNRFYLIEEYGFYTTKSETWEQAIWTIKSQSQVSDGFHIEWTKNLNDTIARLSLRTELIEEEFKMRQSFYVIPDENVNRPTFLGLLDSFYRVKSPFVRPMHTSFKKHAELNTKSYAPLTVVWAKMLLRMHGLSDKKCVPIVEKFDTPQSFWRAIKRQQEIVAKEEEEGRSTKKKKLNKGESFIMDNIKLPTGSIGPVLSKRIWDLWTSESYTIDGGTQ